MKTIDITDLDKQLENATPRQVLTHALETYDNIAIAFSGAEDVILIDIATKLKADISIFCLDTGRLHPETYHYIERVRNHYKINIDMLFPEAQAVEALVRNKGLFSFYNDNHQECCGIRKIEPLRKKLNTLDAWITGQRKDQSPTRADIPVVQHDSMFSDGKRNLTKFNPLANTSSEAVWAHIRALDVPYNPLHDRGYVSIGCEPCTRSIGPNQHEREGRWWWEESTKKECGLHLDNLRPQD